MSRFGRRQPSSIYDLETPEARAARDQSSARTRRRTVALTAAGAVLASAAGGYVLLRGESTSDYTDAPRAHSQLASAGSAEPHIDVVIDGWSLKTLGDRAVTASVNGTTRSVVFEPATAADLAELMGTTPALVGEVMSRMVTDDPALVCDKGGCRTAKGDLSPNLLLDPASIPALGSSYAGYGIGSGLYVAQVPTGGSTGTVDLAADGYVPLALAAGEVTADEELGEVLEPISANGYLQGRFVVGAGLGRLFSLDAAWPGTGKDPVRYAVASPEDPAAGALEAVSAANPAGVATQGLSEPFTPAQSWSDSHLTYATSPTIGCGVEALCVPAPVEVTVERDVRDFAEVCSPGTQQRRGVLALHDTVVTAKLPAPTHQYGLGESDARWGAGDPDTVEGSQQVRFAVVGLFDGDGPMLRATGGRVDSGPGAAVTIDDALAGVRFDGVLWDRC